MSAVSASGCPVEQCALDSSRDWLSVESVIDIILSQSEASYEIEPVFVVDESVAVIILSCGSVHFLLVHPEGILQVLMHAVHSAVEHCHHHARVTSGQFPCILHPHVSTLHSIFRDGSVVYQIPLIVQIWVVESVVFRNHSIRTSGGRRERNCHL